MDSLLKHYEKELSYINKAAKAFAKRFPKIAGRLKLGADELEDPLVERLISAFAFLNARIQNKLEDDFPQLSHALMDTLYPHYNRPIPPMSIVKFDTRKGLKEAQFVPSGIELETYTFEDKSCEFVTCYELNLMPLVSDSVEILFRPFVAPLANQVAGNAVIHLKLNVTASGTTLGDLKPDALTFYIGGQDQRRYILYELLFTQLRAVVVASENGSTNPVMLDPSNVRPVGFGAEQGMLPYPQNAFMGYRLLTEFFTFPDKFFFFTVKGLDRFEFAEGSDAFDLYFYLDNADPELEHYLSTDMFQLGCVPVVNLFNKTAEPIRLDHTKSAHQLVPDASQQNNIEVYQINSVRGVDNDGNKVSFAPFYGQRHTDDAETSCFWHASRRLVTDGEQGTETASEVDLNFVDVNFKPQSSNDVIVTVGTRCLNRNSPSRLPFAGRLPLKSNDSKAPSVDTYCITPPTPTLRIGSDDGNFWRLVSHLNLNHLSLANNENSTQALREILRLYDFRGSASSRTMIGAIEDVVAKPISAPINVDGRSVLCRGSEVVIIFDPLKLGGQSPYLFACVLETFMGLYCSINSFVRVIARLKGSDEELKRWPPRAGAHQLL